MKKIFTLNYIKKAFALCIITLTCQAFAVKTPGSLSFSVTTQNSSCTPCIDAGESADGHVIAIWIENSSNVFVKTKLIYAVNQLGDLTLWNTKSNGNSTDATSGATQFVHGTKTIIWDGTDVAGNLVDDGNYTLWVEIAWNSDGTSSTTSIPFVKGTAVDSKTPPTTNYFAAMSLAWTPSTVGISNNQNDIISIYPNPAVSNVNIDLGNIKSNGQIQILNAIGAEIYSENFQQKSGKLSIDISNYPEGVYFVKVIRDYKLSSYKLTVN